LDIEKQKTRWLTVDAAVSAVRATTELGGLVNLDVVHNQRLGFETLHLSVGLSVGEEIQKHTAALLGPATLDGFVALGLGRARHTYRDENTSDYYGLIMQATFAGIRTNKPTYSPAITNQNKQTLIRTVENCAWVC
jgi:hypothetical protein